MELRHLIYFEAVARHEHVSRAALELAVAQPAITKQLQDLERELGGGPLFERVGRRVRLTETGRVLLAHTRTVLAQVETLRAELRERGGRGGGRVGIGAPPSVGERLLPDVLRRFHRAHPDVELHMVEGDTAHLLQQLDAGAINMAVVTLPLVQRGLQITQLFTEALVVVLPPDHPLIARTELTIADLSAERFLIHSPAGFIREATVQACRQVGFMPQIVIDSGSIDLVLRLVAAGLGVALIPPIALVGNEPLAVRPLVDPPIQRVMGLALREGRALTPAVARMRDEVIVSLRR